MPPTLSKALYLRVFNSNNQTIQNESTISLFQDLSNYQISLVIEQKIADAFEGISLSMK